VTARVVPDFCELAPLLEQARARGARIALTNGCFDLLHVGHLRLLREARSLADLLVVALNDDASARANKGDGRPLVPLAERMELISALEGVDFVTSFGEPTAAALLARLRPEIHVKGTDWTPETAPERDVVRAYGGRVVIAGDPKTHSSSELVRRLRAR
jgi:rfaE bifunctional protein nucleotidyltransferase chain/domain